MSSNSILPETEELYFSHINGALDGAEERVDEAVTLIKNSSSLRKIVVDENLVLKEEKNKKKLLEAILRNDGVKEMEVTLGPFMETDLARWFARALRAMNIEKLIMKFFDTSDTSAVIITEALRANRTLKEICFLFVRRCSKYVEAVSSSISLRATLKTLTVCVGRESLSQEAVLALEEALQRQDSLLEALTVLSWRAPTAASARDLLSALAINKTLKKLALVGFSHRNQEPVGQTVDHLIRTNDTLQELIIELSGWHISNDVTPIIQSLTSGVNQSLRRLELDGWYIGAGNTTRATLMEENNTMQALKLTRSTIDVEGIKSISAALSRATALKHMNLQWSRVDDDDIIHICEAFKDHGALVTLNLSGNIIGDQGCEHIGGALKQNRVVQTVKLLQNGQISDVGARALVEGVKVNHTITMFELENEAISAATKTDLDYYLELNRGPRRLLRASPPLSVWPSALKRAHDCWKTPDMLYFLVKEKIDLSLEASLKGKQLGSCKE